MTKPDFQNMSGPQLVAWYNGTDPAAKLTAPFRTKETGVKRCEARFNALQSNTAKPAEEAEKTQRVVVQPKQDTAYAIQRKEQLAKQAAKKAGLSAAKASKSTAPPTKALPPAKARITEATSSKRGAKKIKLLVGNNPRKAGTDAHRHFEAMKGEPTVDAYLEKFEEGDSRKKASQWLSNTVRDEYAKLED